MHKPYSNSTAVNTLDARSNGNSFATEHNGIYIAPRVVFTLALRVALSTYGVVAIASRYTGFDCTHTEPRRGLDIKLNDDASDHTHVTVDVNIIAEYGVRIQSVTSSLQHQIQYSIERSTGYTVDAIHVHVSGLRVTNEN